MSTYDSGIPRQLASRAELPAWFDVANYQSACTLDSLGWYWQLNARANLLPFIADPVSPGFYERWPTNPRALHAERMGMLATELLAKIRVNPLIDHTSHDFTDRYVGTLLSRHLGLSAASLPDIGAFVSLFEPGRKDAIMRTISGDNPEGKSLTQNEWTRAGVSGLNSALIRVDLSLPESALIDGFTRLIRELKGTPTEEATSVRAPKFSEWVRLGLLPYLDLYTWQLEANVSIPNRVFADAIFTSELEAEETVRKTTSKLARQILDGQIYPALALL